MTQPAARAFLALWNGISRPAFSQEYEIWHSFEHVPERVGLPGFIEARRYRAVDNPSFYFTCYWLTSLDALATPRYQEVFSHPTPWSARVRLEMRDFFRMPCELAASHGNSAAARVATLQLRSTSGDFAEQLDAWLAHAVQSAGLVCAHWGPARPDDTFPLANKIVAAADDNSPGRNLGQDYVVMLQHLDLAPLRASALALQQHLAHLASAVTAPVFFELLTTVRQDELLSPLTQRQPQRPELMRQLMQGDTT